MNQAEVIGPEVQGNSRFQIGQFAGEGQGEPVKSSNLHSERQILPLHIRRTNLAVVGDTDHFRDLRSRHARRRIAAWSRVLCGVQLGDGGIRGPISKEAANSRTIGPPRIGTHLRCSFNTLAQILDELERIGYIPPPHMKGRNDLGNRIERNVGKLIAKLRAAFRSSAFIAPDFLPTNVQISSHSMASK